MGDPTLTDFLQKNLILIGFILIAIFVYLVLLIRKRWKQGFLHTPPKDEKK